MIRPCHARVEAATPSRGVLPAINDVAGIAVAGVSACVMESLPCGSLPDAVVHIVCIRVVRYDCLSLPSWWSVHRSLMVLACSSTGLLQGYRAHARRRALGLLHSSLLDERLCLAVQVATRSSRRLGHRLELVGYNDEFFTGPFQFRRFVDVVIG